MLRRTLAASCGTYSGGAPGPATWAADASPLAVPSGARLAARDAAGGYRDGPGTASTPFPQGRAGSARGLRDLSPPGGIQAGAPVGIAWSRVGSRPPHHRRLLGNLWCQCRSMMRMPWWSTDCPGGRVVGRSCIGMGPVDVRVIASCASRRFTNVWTPEGALDFADGRRVYPAARVGPIARAGSRS